MTDFPLQHAVPTNIPLPSWDDLLIARITASGFNSVFPNETSPPISSVYAAAQNLARITGALDPEFYIDVRLGQENVLFDAGSEERASEVHCDSVYDVIAGTFIGVYGSPNQMTRVLMRGSLDRNTEDVRYSELEPITPGFFCDINATPHSPPIVFSQSELDNKLFVRMTILDRSKEI